MKKLLLSFMALFVALTFLSVGCSQEETTKKKPTYPACETNKDCASHGEYCVNKVCRECGTDKHCKSKGPCMECKNYKCVRKKNCCLNDKDCPRGTRCFVKPGKKEGVCK